MIYLERKSQFVLCIGACHIDYKFLAQEEIVQKTSNPIKSMYNYGGVIRNVANNLSLLEVNVSIMSLVGNDFNGEKLIKDTGREMNVDLIDKVPNQATGMYYAVVNPQGDMDVAFADMGIYDLMDHEWIHRKTGNLKKYDWIIADMNVQKSGLEALISFNNSNNSKLAIIGVSGPKTKNLPDDLKGLDIIICNKDESMAYFNTDNGDIKELVAMWLEKGIKQVVITSGENDIAYASDIRNIQSRLVKKIDSNEMVDATGAGDAFSAGVIYGLVKNASINKSILYGLVNARRTLLVKDSVRKDLTVDRLKKEELDYE